MPAAMTRPRSPPGPNARPPGRKVREAPDGKRASPRPAPKRARRDVFVYFDNDAKVRAPFRCTSARDGGRETPRFRQRNCTPQDTLAEHGRNLGSQKIGETDPCPLSGEAQFRCHAEPSGGKPTAEGNSFVVQKHAARRLHYDFRLELDGVLLSWAVPRGPSLDPADKRLAAHVEDHPIDYGGFEGTIPQGQYGGGTVMLWDRGTWEPQAGEDPREGYRKGRLKFILHGERMKGGWTLVRMGPRGQERNSDNWLLIKERDSEARPGEGTLLVDKGMKSVASGRTMEQIADAPDRDVWHSNRAERRKAESEKQRRKSPPRRKPPPLRARTASNAVPCPISSRRRWQRSSITRPVAGNGCMRSRSMAIASSRAAATARSRC